MTEKRCGNCRFWNYRSESDDGECRVRAPSIVLGMLTLEGKPCTDTDAATIGFWPNTSDLDWCGEFNPSHA